METPKNQAAEYFKLVEDRKEAEKVFAKLRGRSCGFYIVPGSKKKDSHEEEDGQMNLFAAGDMPGADSEPSGIVESAENDAVEYCLGAAISTGEEETFFIKAGENLPAKQILSMFTASEAASYATLDLKPQLAALGLLERQVNGNIGLSNLFDGVLAAYLLNPLKNEYPYEDIAKDYMGQMIPSKADLLGKLTIEQAMKDAPEAFLNYVCYMAYVAQASKKTLETDLKEEAWIICLRNRDAARIYSCRYGK